MSKQVKPLSKTYLKRPRSQLNANELKFIQAWVEKRDYTKACQIAYPNLKDANVYGYQLSQKPLIKAKIDAIKNKLLAEVDEEYIVRKYKERVEKFEDDPLPELPKMEFSLKALNGLANFRKKNETSAPAQILINIDGSLLGNAEKNN